MRRIESQREQWPHRVSALHRRADESQSGPTATTLFDSTSGLEAGTGIGVGYAGNDAATKLVQDAAGKPYEFGGSGPGSTNVDKNQPASSWDCSGITGDAAAAFLGQPTAGEYTKDGQGARFNTTSDFGAMGFEPGYQPGSYNIGVNPQAGGDGHMAGELPGGQGFESSSSDGVEYGSGAKDVNSFQQQWHLPGSGEFNSGLADQAMSSMKSSRRRVAIPKNPSRQDLHKIMEAIEQGGWEGITFRDRPGDGPTSGYMVSLPGKERSHPMDELSGEQIGSYLREQGDDVGPDDGYGGWHEDDDDGDLWYHDISRNIEDTYDATRAALDWKQKAIFDNSKHDPRGNPLDSAYLYTGPLANSGPASAAGWIQAHTRRTP